MLVLTRKENEKIKIGDEVVVSVLSVEGNNVKIGIDAPREITILRMEVFEQIQKENIESAEKDLGDITQAAALIKKKFFKE
ncbi:MAG: carbon storage regulator CsrA [Desulfobacter sp.]|nr:carbon storage regulator CsrA [Desulfobacter sp.]WDP87264.1 MAG: carbon storage regulator CsrA [Desulfobacter sp.]